MEETQNSESRLFKWLPFFLSVIATPFLFLAGLLSAGAGHGDYIAAIILFPYPLLSAVLRQAIFHPPFGDSQPFDTVFLLLAVIQFPIYGLLISLVKRKLIFIIVIGILHLVFSAITFWLAISTGFL